MAIWIVVEEDQTTLQKPALLLFRGRLLVGARVWEYAQHSLTTDEYVTKPDINII